MAIFTGTSGANNLTGTTGADVMIGLGGVDTYTVNNAGDICVENSADISIDKINATVSYTLSDNIEWLTFSGTSSFTGTGNHSDNSITGSTGNDTLDGRDGNDTINGGNGNNSILGGAGNDSLTGGIGKDTIDGGLGNDTMTGGLGDDIYYVNSSSDKIVEDTVTGSGNDTAYISQTFSGSLANVEVLKILPGLTTGIALTLSDSTNHTITGGGGDDTITGGSGKDSIQGGAGSDSISGGAGDDTIDGNAGSDTLDGGNGSDTYRVNSSTDVVTDTGTGASDIDIVSSSAAVYSLTQSAIDAGASDAATADSGIEKLILQTTAFAGFGDIKANTITGNSADNWIEGGKGADSLTGDSGNDTIVAGGADVIPSIDWTKPVSTWYTSATDADALNGGAGNDTYYVNSTAATIADSAGTDTVYSSVTINLSSSTIENLTLMGTTTGTAADTDVINGIGNKLPNTITGNAGVNSIDGGDGNDTLVGNAGADTLIGSAGNDSLSGGLGDDILYGDTTVNGAGGTGIDTLVGGAGDDTYYVNNASDKINETVTGSDGTDTVISTVSFSLSAFTGVDNLTLQGTAAVNGTGNTAVNTITGNTANNKIDDGDTNTSILVNTLIGDAGNDTYVVHSANDVITETTGNGTDLVQAYSATVGTTFTLNSNVENLTLMGTIAINGTGNDDAAGNTITGNGANNVLIGLKGNDSISGGDGNDTIYGNTTVAGATSTDTDTLSGGDGDDTYYVNSVSAKVSELGTSGNDTINSNVSFSLSAGVETLNLIGAKDSTTGKYIDPLNGTGNTTTASTINGNDGANSLIGGTAVDTLVGNAGDDTLNSGGGADSLQGGLGNDTYYVSNSDATVTEVSGEGTADTISSSVSFVVPTAVEVLTLTTGNTSGDASLLSTAVTINGSAGNNLLTGGKVADILVGNSGADTLIGGTGADNLTGGSGIDVFKYTAIGDLSATALLSDTIADFGSSTDKIDVSAINGGGWVLGGATDGSINSVIFSTSGGNGLLTLYVADGNATADAVIALTGTTTFVQGDLIAS